MYILKYTIQGRGAIKKLNKRHVDLKDFTTDRKRRKLTPAERDRQGLAKYEKRINPLMPHENSAQILKDFRFCILSGNREHSKQQLEILAKQNGGTIIPNPLPNDPQCICIAGERIYLVERLMQQRPRTVDIVNLDWLLRVCEKKQIDLRPKDVLSATDALRAQFSRSFDEVGDSYTESLSSIDELWDVMQDISEEQLNSDHIDQQMINSLENKLLGRTSHMIFGNQFGFFYHRHVDELARLWFMQRGGTLVTDLNDPNLAFVFVCRDDLKRQDIEKLHSKLDTTSCHFQVVTTDWIRQSHRARFALPTDDFLLKL